MYNLSVRERKLLAVLAVLLALVIWYKTFAGFLLPSYHQIHQQREQAITLEQEISSLLAEITEKESQIKQMKSEVENMKYQFTSHVGFLLYDIGKLAKDEVTLLGVDTQDIKNEGYFQMKSISIRLEGSFHAVIDFVRELENLSGVNINRVDLNGTNEGDSGMIEASLLVHLYDFDAKEIFPSGKGFYYEPFQNPNPFGANWHEIDENTGETPDNTGLEEEPLLQDSHLANPRPLAPYTFPVK